MKRKTKLGRRKRGRPTTYPWAKWFSKRRFTLIRGDHYHCEPHSMMGQLRQQAIRRRRMISVSITGGRLRVRVGA